MLLIEVVLSFFFSAVTLLGSSLSKTCSADSQKFSITMNGGRTLANF